MREIGLITFHAAYNFGSMLQAVATQTAIEALSPGYSCRIINYRPTGQKSFYNHLLRTGYGLKTFLKDVNQLPAWHARKKRQARFEGFLERYMKTTEEFADPSAFSGQASCFDAIVSGSDQIWNKHAHELSRAPWECIEPYLLHQYEGHKVSYASSLGNMSKREAERLFPYLCSYDYLSVREQQGASLLNDVCGISAQVVADPTFLLDKEQWLSCLDVRSDGEYESALLYYSLAGVKPLKARLARLVSIAKAKHCSGVLIVTPFARVSCSDAYVKMRHDFGPIEFVQAMLESKCVITDSFHGTMLAINYGKDFTSILRGTEVDYRITEVLERLGLEDRAVKQADDFSIPYCDFDYQQNSCHEQIKQMRMQGIQFLRRALS